MVHCGLDFLQTSKKKENAGLPDFVNLWEKHLKKEENEELYGILWCTSEPPSNGMFFSRKSLLFLEKTTTKHPSYWECLSSKVLTSAECLF